MCIRDRNQVNRAARRSRRAFEGWFATAAGLPPPEGDGEEDSEDAADAEDSEAAKPPSVTHTTHTKLCVYAVPRDAPTGAAAGFSPPETPASSPAYRERAQFSFSLDGRVASETGSPKRSPPFAPKLVEALDDPPSRRSQTSASARRLARILNARGGPAAGSAPARSRTPFPPRRGPRQSALAPLTSYFLNW